MSRAHLLDVSLELLLYLSIRQHTSAYVSISEAHAHLLDVSLELLLYLSIRQHTSAYVSACTPPRCLFRAASVSQHTSAYVSIRQHTSADAHLLDVSFELLPYLIHPILPAPHYGLRLESPLRVSMCTFVLVKQGNGVP